jgi:hypothetical protein
MKNLDKFKTNYLYNQNPSAIEDIKMYKNRPLNPNVYLRFPDHVPTLKDFECLSAFDAVVCNERSFAILIFKFLLEEHAGLIFINSLMYPK